MGTNVPDKLLEIVKEIKVHGSANLTRLTVLKKWFSSARLAAFAIWLAKRAVAHPGQIGGARAELFRAARRLLRGVDPHHPVLNRQAAQALHDRLRAFQDHYQHQQWGPVRIIHDWKLLLVEQGLAIFLWHTDSPARGYKLAVDYCQHYDPRCGNGLNGPSRAKIQELVRFLSRTEALEAESK
jgi:hypothetical protein